MAITKKQKEEILSDLETVLAENDSVAFVNFNGLSVQDTTELRGKLRDDGVGYKVIKKTLVRRALDNTKVEGDVPALDGELAIVWGEETAPARGIYDFAKAGHGDNLQLVGGIFEGKYLDKDGINEIASIPGIDVLRGMFVNVINSPIQGLAVALGQIAEQKEA